MPKKNKLKNKWLDNANGYGKSQKQTKEEKASKSLKGKEEGHHEKKATTKVRKGGKKKAVRRKAVAPRPRTTRAKTVPSSAAFTEIASEEVTSPTAGLGEQETIGSTGSSGVDKSEFTSTDGNSYTNSI
ncbi:MAG: hypothetical protein M3299_04185 [Thermoproteota archaeon]|nr:hypothetical protein [Thermoproteota archaeon]